MNDLYSRSITSYCERVGNGIWSEPVNAVSNIAFLVVGYLIWKQLVRGTVRQVGFWLLLFLVLLIGAGSALWHTIHTPIAHALDAVPIFGFFILYLFLLFTKLVNKRAQALILTGLFVVLQISVSIWFPEVLNGSIRHVVNVGVFSTLLLWIYRKYPTIVRSFLLALSAYVLGIIFRSIDIRICSAFPLGTHFLWHIGTATAVYFAVKALILMDMRRGS